MESDDELKTFDADGTLSVSQSHLGRPVPASVNSFPVDESVYGVRGLGGNARGWCGDAWLKDGPPAPEGVAAPPSGPAAPGDLVVYRGGSWVLGDVFGRSSGRSPLASGSRHGDISFRLARPLTG